jgi:EAL domain-containing protein (putative c-di-GMP-specific phosphodiesterase class I)
VPLAEETGLIVRLGRWVLREACRQVELWRAMYPELSLTMAVNVSGRQLHELDIVSETRQALADTRVEPGAVVLEITESVLMQQTGQVLARLRELKRSVCNSRSTTSGPAIPRWAICSASPST